jgi:CRP-like cAMP-binding protein
MQSELAFYIQSTFGLAPNDLEQITGFFKPLHLQKNEYFQKTGHYAQQMGFLQSGLIREYVEMEDKEVTKWISGKGYFIVDLASFLFEKPGRWNLQALTDCELHVINKSDYAQIGQHVPKWPVLEKLFIARCFTILEDRVLSHLALSAEERYDRFFQYNPDLFNQAPLQYLASMLGMTPETFSRIRKKQALRNS